MDHSKSYTLRTYNSTRDRSITPKFELAKMSFEDSLFDLITASFFLYEKHVSKETLSWATWGLGSECRARSSQQPRAKKQREQPRCLRTYHSFNGIAVTVCMPFSRSRHSPFWGDCYKRIPQLFQKVLLGEKKKVVAVSKGINSDLTSARGQKFRIIILWTPGAICSNSSYRLIIPVILQGHTWRSPPA